MLSLLSYIFRISVSFWAMSCTSSDGMSAMKMDFWTLVLPFFSRNIAIYVLTLLLVMSYMMKHIIYPGFLSAEEMMFSICLILSGRVGSSSKFPVTLPMEPVPAKPAWPISLVSMRWFPFMRYMSEFVRSHLPVAPSCH